MKRKIGGSNVVSEEHLSTEIKENKKWEIESIQTLGEDDDNDPMMTQVTTTDGWNMGHTEMITDTAISSNGQFMIESVSEIEEPTMTQLTETKLEVDLHDKRDERDTVKSTSVFVQETWTEDHTIPIHSSTVQMRIDEPPTQRSMYTITSARNAGSDSKAVFTADIPIKIPIKQPRNEMAKRSLYNGYERDFRDKQKPVDHYTYEYEDAVKTQKIKQLATSVNKRHSPVYDSLARPLSRPTISYQSLPITQGPTTNCMRQSIQVDNDDEEMIGEPLILDEYQQPIRNLSETRSFNSIMENVSFQIHELKAEMKIEIAVEMYHNTGQDRQIWKRKQVKVTRIVELDLSKVWDKERLRDIVARCNISTHEVGERRLAGKDAYQVFYHLMAITHEEEDKSETKENLYLTRSPSGKLTSLKCEPQFLLSGVQGRENSTMFY